MNTLPADRPSVSVVLPVCQHGSTTVAVVNQPERQQDAPRHLAVRHRPGSFFPERANFSPSRGRPDRRAWTPQTRVGDGRSLIWLA